MLGQAELTFLQNIKGDLFVQLTGMGELARPESATWQQGAVYG